MVADGNPFKITNSKAMLQKNIFHIILVSLALMTTSCASEYEPPVYPTVETEDGNIVKYIEQDTTICLRKDFPLFNGNISLSEVVCDSVEGYRRYEEPKYWAMAYFIADSSIDLPQGRYLYKEITYFHHMPARANERIKPITPYFGRMGIHPRSTAEDCRIGYEADIVNEAGYVWGETRILHIKYDANGKLIDLWWPCHPDKLRWHFTWKPWIDPWE